MPLTHRIDSRFAHRERHRGVNSLFNPSSVAIVGASEQEGSVGAALLKNVRSKRRRVFAVNPNHDSLLGERCYADLLSIGEPIDLAIIATPASTVVDIAVDCVAADVSAAIIISAGFKETGEAGAHIEAEIRRITKGKLRILGPNCFGVMAPHHDLNATFAPHMALPGHVGFISQSGALGAAILDWSLNEKVGFSAFVSVGSMLDISWGDIIYHLGDDPNTKSIVMYMESVGRARSFLSAAREVALSKPIVLLKAGRTEGGARAAVSHTGAMTGSDAVLNAALRRVGVLRVESVEELFDMAELLSKQPRPRGGRLAIVTNAGGPGVLAADTIIESGGSVAALTADSISTLNDFLPEHWSHGDPVDILGDADSNRYAEALQIVAKDSNVDGTLAILTPQAMSDPVGSATVLCNSPSSDGKPLLACWMGGASVETAKQRLNAAGIGTFDYPEKAARAFSYMAKYDYNVRGIYETPSLIISERNGIARRDAKFLIDAARKTRRTLLTNYEAKKILQGYGIPTAETHIAFTKREASRIAKTIGYPVAVKLYSETLTHKTEVDGVYLNVCRPIELFHAWDKIEEHVNERAGHQHFLGVTLEPMIVRAGYELLLGTSVDPEFGPVLMFGTGGILCEVFQDHSLALPPLNSTLARRMMEQTRIFKALRGIRGRSAVNLEILEGILINLGQLAVEQRWIREIDINPLLASPEGCIALDARVVLYEETTREEDLPVLAIKPYPQQYIVPFAMHDGTSVTIRPIRPEDEPLLIRFHAGLSEQTVYYRYFGPLKMSERIAHKRLARVCFNDYDREIALVGEVQARDERQIIGVGRLTKLHDYNAAEFALVVADRWQNLGLGTELLKLVMRVAGEENIERVFGLIHRENHSMLRVCRHLGLHIHETEDHAELVAEFSPSESDTIA